MRDSSALKCCVCTPIRWKSSALEFEPRREEPRWIISPIPKGYESYKSPFWYEPRVSKVQSLSLFGW